MDISLTLDEGESLSLVGESVYGKTTTGTTIQCTLDDPLRIHRLYPGPVREEGFYLLEKVGLTPDQASRYIQ
jgi:ABC-type dipeptide/oligopeptide/nickel transport system ATPase component